MRISGFQIHKKLATRNSQLATQVKMILPIYAYGQPVLKKVGEPIDKDYPNLNELIKNMWQTMYNAEGVGLAAPQIGLPIRLFLVDTVQSMEEGKEDEGIKRVFINAQKVEETGKHWDYEEGCLSLPGVFDEVTRSESLTVEYRDPYGDQHTLNADGLLSICIQHENDHLDGIVFIEHLSNLKFNLYRKKLIKSKKLSKQE